MAALYSDSDYDEEFEDDYSPTRCVVPSYAQLYSLQLTAGGGAGDEDDGWNSDDESCKPVIPAMEEEEDPNPFLQKYKRPFMMYEDDVWVDEAKAVVGSPGGGQKIGDCLREMFEEHKDVFSLMLCFLQRSGKNRHQKQSLVRRVVEEFKRWRRSVPHSENAVLTYNHQVEALGLLTRCHPMLMDDLCALFDLKSAPERDKVFLIKALLAEKKMNRAVTYTYKLGLQKHFDSAELLLPLLVVDKVNLIESYIDSSRELQEEFVTLVDKLCEPGSTYKQIKSFLECCSVNTSLVNPEDLMNPNSKLNSQQLYKLGQRLVCKYDLQLDKFPHLNKRRTFASLSHMLRSKYIERAITDENIDDLIGAAFSHHSSFSLKLHLIKELLRFDDKPAAAKWAQRLDIAMEYLPFTLQTYIIAGSRGEDAIKSKVLDETAATVDVSECYCSLSVPLSQVVFVDDEQGLMSCWKAIRKPNVIIGVDGEWRLPACNGGVERLALLQLALSSTIFLLDMIRLPDVLPVKTFKEFMHFLFGSRNNLKLGYGIMADFKIMTRSWRFLSDVFSSPQRVLDLQMFARMVERLKLSALVKRNDVLPCHPLFLPLGGRKEPIPLHSEGSSHDENTSLSSSVNTTELKEDTISSSDSGKAPPTDELAPPQATPPSSIHDDPSVNSGNGNGEDVGGYSTATGLSLLVEKCLGKPLDKSQQLSDWERRPLRENQIRYAALDAHCLLSVYECLKSQALAIDPHFNIEPTTDC